MKFGKPVFLSKATSLPEIGGAAAFYFTEFTTEAMQQVFETGMHMYQSKQLSEGIKLHAQQFNWSAAAQQYLDVYRSLY